MSDHVAHFVSHGVFFRLRAPTGQQLRSMMAVLPYGTVADDSSTENAEEFLLATDTVEGQTPEEQLRTALMVHVANFAPEHVFVHAGVVSWNGKGLILPGRSFAGKTTLVAALVGAGCLYYSDEHALIAPSGPRPALRSQTAGPVARQRCATPTRVSKLGGQSGTEPLTISLVAFLRYESGVAWSS